MIHPPPSRGEIWLVSLNPIRGREQAGTRPCLIVSVDHFNYGPADLVIVVPLTSAERHIPMHVAVEPPQGGLTQRSFIKCEDIRSISKDRLIAKWGSVSQLVMSDVEERIRTILDL